MTDVLRKEITPGSSIVLDGIEFRLTLPVRAVLAFKQRTGIDLFNPGVEVSKAETTENIVGLFHAMIGQSQPEITFDRLTDIIDLGNIAQVRAAVMECVASYLPDKRTREEGEESPNAETAPVS